MVIGYKSLLQPQTKVLERPIDELQKVKYQSSKLFSNDLLSAKITNNQRSINQNYSSILSLCYDLFCACEKTEPPQSINPSNRNMEY